jgi:glycosyltransferase involved in cell wall biosynthesis
MNFPSFGQSGFFDQISVIRVPSDCQVVFVADMFSSDYKGGAELTTDALIDSSPFKVFRLHSKDVTVELLEEGHQKFWIFGNFSNVNPQLIPTIVANMKYAILEYDYKFCRYRSPEKHAAAEGIPCACQNETSGKMVSAFMYGARSLWWMSEEQKNSYLDHFPFLEERPNTVLSSVFSETTFAAVKLLRDTYKDSERKGWVVLNSPSWVKGADAAKAWCKENNKESIELWGVDYAEVLEILAQAEGFVYLPEGKDTCPRMVIEAHLLGCELHLNDNVQHKDELWFNTDDMLDTESYLYMARQRFWNGIKADMEYRATLSGYTTTQNCISQEYPFIQSITSLLGFCEEVVVVDGGSTDGTWEKLEELASQSERLVIHQEIRDWTHPRFAVFDGLQKAKARSLCTQEFCWQQDSDEIVHDSDYEKIRGMVSEFPNSAEVICLPVIEYWGGPDKVRMDILPWKWRLSRNLPHITHGIPAAFRQVDVDGNLYASPGTDGCDYVHAETYEVIPNIGFYTQEVHNARLAGLAGNNEARQGYENWFNSIVEQIPGVHHYSWFDLPRKIRTYRDYWSTHWQSLYNIEQGDTAENNMFFQRPWSEVSDSDISELATKLSSEMGGWVFHTPVDFDTPTPNISINRGHPWVMSDYLTRHSPGLDDEVITSIASHLIGLKNDDDWADVRSADAHYERIEVDYPFGTRTVLRLKNEQSKYVDLQQSRGIPIQAGDSVEEVLGRAISATSERKESDAVRIVELDQELAKLNHSVAGIAELGFRVPKLLKHYLDAGATHARGYDVAPLSVEVSTRLGYDGRLFDFNSCEGELNLDGCDVVMSYHMLEHLTDPQIAVSTIYEAMDSAAYFHVEIPVEPNGPHIQFAHLFPFHANDLRHMLTTAGFEILNVSTKTHSGGPLVERYLTRKPAEG